MAQVTPTKVKMAVGIWTLNMRSQKLSSTKLYVSVSQQAVDVQTVELNVQIMIRNNTHMV